MSYRLDAKASTRSERSVCNLHGEQSVYCRHLKRFFLKVVSLRIGSLNV